MRLTKFHAVTLGLAVAALLSAESALAELYISPVKEDVLRRVQITGEGSAAGAVRILGQSAEGHSFFMEEEKLFGENETTLRFGRDVPLEAAIRAVIPNGSAWAIQSDDPDLIRQAISWDGGNTWEEVIHAIADQNHLAIALNHDERAVGISRNPKVAPIIAYRDNRVWRLDPALSLRKNLERWGEISGEWSIVWGDEVKRFDYDVPVGTAFYGPLVGEDGVIAALMNAYKNAKKPLAAVPHWGNKAIQITAGGYQQYPSAR